MNNEKCFICVVVLLKKKKIRNREWEWEKEINRLMKIFKDINDFVEIKLL